MQGTKTGSVFVLDARTGEAVKPVQERPVPAGTLPGERYAPTQPQSVGMPNFAGMPGPEPEVLTEANSFGLTPIDAALCRIAFRQMEYEGMYTPRADRGGGSSGADLLHLSNKKSHFHPCARLNPVL